MLSIQRDEQGWSLWCDGHKAPLTTTMSKALATRVLEALAAEIASGRATKGDAVFSALQRRAARLRLLDIMAQAAHPKRETLQICPPQFIGEPFEAPCSRGAAASP